VSLSTAPTLVDQLKANRQAAWPYLGIFAVFLLLTVFTRSAFLGDTIFYVSDINASLACPSLGQCPTVWDAGHLLWRPAGHWLLRPLLPLLSYVVGRNLAMATTLLLVSMSSLATLIAALLAYAIIFKETGNLRISLFLSVVFLCANTNLYGLHSGTSYSSGLACLMAAVWCSQRARHDGMLRYAALAGMWEALAVGFWLPYIVALPALLLWTLFACLGRRVETGTALLLMTMLAGLALFGLGSYFAGVRSVAELRAWVGNSGHGMSQTHNLIRAVWGLPRSFLELGQFGVRIKQFLFKDPYARVSLGELFSQAVWKIIVFYLALLGLVSLGLTDKGKQTLAIFAVAMAGDVLLASVFEAGSPERYLPIFPFLFLAVAACIVTRQTPRAARIAVSAVCFLMIANLISASAIRIHNEEEKAVRRVKPLLPLPPHSLIFVVGDDSVAHLRLNAPLHEINQANFETAGLYTPMIRTALWKYDFASRVLAAWKQGGSIWITTRVRAMQPRREWNWVEGDDPNIMWRDIVEFFKAFEFSQDPSGEDGFTLLPQSVHNQDQLQLFANSTVN